LNWLLDHDDNELLSAKPSPTPALEETHRQCRRRQSFANQILLVQRSILPVRIR